MFRGRLLARFRSGLGALGLAGAWAGFAICAAPTLADEVHVGDVIIGGDLCIGENCADGEALGDNSVLLKSNAIQIELRDTSTAAGYPGNDWRVRVNEPGVGGAEQLALDDATAGTTPLLIEAGAPTAALHVGAAGHVGFGTAMPLADLHALSGDTPTLRLEQDGSTGQTPQAWALAGNEQHFFVHDASNGSALPFAIGAGAPSDALVIDSSGAVGLGTATPGAALHVTGNSSATQLRVENTNATIQPRTLLSLRNNGIAAFNMVDSSPGGGVWGFQNRGSKSANEFRITNPVGAGDELRLTRTGDLIITGTLTTAGTTCGGGCDAVFDADYDLPSIGEHAERMFALGHLPNVGPTPEGAPFDMTEKLGRILNELEHAHIYIAQQDARIAALEARLAALEPD